VFTSLEEKIVSVCQDTLTKLYGKDNFCRKHVFYINESIEVVNKVIVDSAKQLFLDKLPKEFQPDSFLKFCYTPFKNISTEHKLLKKLLSDESFEKPFVFDVNNEVQEVQKCYKPTLDAGNKKGCVMPIKF